MSLPIASPLVLLRLLQLWHWDIHQPSQRLLSLNKPDQCRLKLLIHNLLHHADLKLNRPVSKSPVPVLTCRPLSLHFHDLRQCMDLGRQRRHRTPMRPHSPLQQAELVLCLNILLLSHQWMAKSTTVYNAGKELQFSNSDLAEPWCRVSLSIRHGILLAKQHP